MTILRNPQEKSGFKAIARSLFQGLKDKPHLTLQSVQHELAIALGARSLEAYLAQLDAVEMSQTSANSDFEMYWKKAKESWYVLTYQFKTPYGPRRLAAHGKYQAEVDYSPEHVTGSEIDLEDSKKKGDTPLYYAPFGHELIVVGKEDSLEWGSVIESPVNLPEGAIEGTGETMLLSEYRPGLFQLMMASEEEISTFLDTKSWVFMFELGFNYAEHSEAVRNEETKLNYAKWAMHELSSWVDDLQVNA